MKLFAKWFYGFRAETAPIITFQSDSARDKLLREAAPGDRIVFVGT